MNDVLSQVFLSDYIFIVAIYGLIAFCILNRLFGYVTHSSFSMVDALFITEPYFSPTCVHCYIIPESILAFFVTHNRQKSFHYLTSIPHTRSNDEFINAELVNSRTDSFYWRI